MPYLTNRDRYRIRAALVVTGLVLAGLAGAGGYLRDIPPDYCPADPYAYRSADLLPPGCRP